MRSVGSVLSRLALVAGFALLAPLARSTPVSAANMFDPDVTWQTIVTPHFRVNFPAGNEAIARLAANYAEEAHTLVSPYLDSVPINRTELTLLDHEDTVNGFGFPLPNNQIFIYLTSPQEDQLMGRYDAWLRDLLIHEYTHVLHMEKTAGLPAWINGFFGRSLFPNLLQPIFLIEGLGVTTETKFSTGGRGRETAYRTFLRLAALADRLVGIDQASGYFTIDHPGGEIPYIYGTAFYRYLIRHYGDAVPRELATRYAAYPFFGVYGIDRVLTELTGKDANALWADMQQELKIEAAVQVAAIAANGPLTETTPVTSGGMHHRHPQFTAQGELVWAEWTGHGYANLFGRKLAPEEKPTSPRRIISKGPFGRYAFSTDGRYIYHTRNWDENRFTSFDDLFRWDTKDRHLSRLSERARLDEPTVSPDGRWVVAVQGGGGQTNLVTLRADGSARRALTTFHDQTQFSGPSFHPRGHLLAASVWKDGSRDPYVIDPHSGAMKPLWRDRDVDINMSWSPDGRYLVFASDRSGVYNLYAYELKRRQLWRMTNVIGGLLEPTVSPDGKTMAATQFGPTGYDVVTLPWDPTTWQRVPVPVIDRTIAQPPPLLPQPATAPYPVIGYDALPSLRPKVWAPFSFFDERGPVLGVTTIGQDALMKHFLYGAFGMGLASGRPFYSLGYSNETLYPSLYASLADTTLVSQPTHEGVSYYMAQRGLYQGLSVTFPGLPSAFLQNSWVTGDQLSLGLSLANVSPLTALDQNLPKEKLPPTGQTNSVSVTYRYGDNYKFAYSISPEGGNLVTLGYERALPALGSQHSFDRVWADWRRYVAMPIPHHVLAVRASGGANFGQQGGNFYLGGFDSATLLSTVDLRTASGLGTRILPLRGYPIGTLTGPLGAALSLEYRFPLANIQRGYGIYPIFIRNVHGALFAEAGQAWGGPPGQPFAWQRSLPTVGAELRAQTHFMQAPTEVRLGLGQGLIATSRTWQWPALYVDIGTYF